MQAPFTQLGKVRRWQNRGSAAAPAPALDAGTRGKIYASASLRVLILIASLARIHPSSLSEVSPLAVCFPPRGTHSPYATRQYAVHPPAAQVPQDTLSTPDPAVSSTVPRRAAPRPLGNSCTTYLVRY